MNISTFMTGHGNCSHFRWSIPTRLMRFPHPATLPGALDAAQDVARDIDYCRVDLMLQSDAVVFSEITLSPRRGKLKITPAEWDVKLGEMWQLPGEQTTGSDEPVRVSPLIRFICRPREGKHRVMIGARYRLHRHRVHS